MLAHQVRLQKVASQLPAQQLEEVIDFAEFLSSKTARTTQNEAQERAPIKRLDIPVIKGVKFIGDPRLRREDMYDDSGR